MIRKVQSVVRADTCPLPQTAAWLEEAVGSAGELVRGKEQVVRLALACFLARGHLLIEDLPGVGKTLLAHVLARVLGLQFQRIQFTSDLLPSDITGVGVFDRNAGAFTFHPGPIFSQVILADEVNRAPPKAQSALLEAMEEHQVTAEGQTRPLPEPFFVIATQNPVCQVGTHPLPESQLDRFLMRLHLGYPAPEAERQLLSGRDPRERVGDVAPCADAADIAAARRAVEQVHTAAAVLDYVQDILHYSRNHPALAHGLSPRAGMALLRSARAWALSSGRDYVLPEDVQQVLPAVVGHRLLPSEDRGPDAVANLLTELLTAVPVP